MHPISIPDYEVTPMNHIAPGIRGLRIAFVNVFSVSHPDGSWTLIDTALPLSARRIVHWSKTFSNTAPNAILLTHGHFDHVSAAYDLAQEWKVPIYTHPFEAPYLRGLKKYAQPAAETEGRTVNWLSSLYPKEPVDLGERLRLLPLSDACVLREMPGWQIIHTPGHTPGHVSLFRHSDRSLIAGDAFCTTKPESFFEAAIAQPAELCGPPAHLTSDWASARYSVQRLAALKPFVVAPGHGKPLCSPMLPAQLNQLAETFASLDLWNASKRSAA